MSSVITTQNTAGTMLTTLGLGIAGALLVAACIIGIVIKKKCSASSLSATQQSSLQTTLAVGASIGGLIILMSILFAVMSRRD